MSSGFVCKAVSFIFAVVFLFSYLGSGLCSKEYLGASSQVERISEGLQGVAIKNGPVTPAKTRAYTAVLYKLALSDDTINSLIDSILGKLSKGDAEEFNKILKEGREYKKEKGYFPFRAWELLRVFYALERLGTPDKKGGIIHIDKLESIELFLKALRDRGDKFVSYIDAFSGIGIEEHLRCAESLLNRKDRRRTDIELAQYHIGRVLGELIREYGKDAYKRRYFKAAMSLLRNPRYGAVDIAGFSDIGNPIRYGLGSFARDLVRRDTLIRYYEKGNLKDVTIKGEDLEQFEIFNRGTEEKSDDSVLFPIPGKKVTFKKKGCTEDTIMGYEDLRKYAEDKGLVKKVAMSIHAGGKGERYDTVYYDVKGKKCLANRAKGVYKLPIDTGISFIEMFIRQVTGNNWEYRKGGFKIPVIIYASIFTEDEVSEELERLGYTESGKNEIYSLYKHKNNFLPDVKVVYCSTTHVLDSKTSDFVTHGRLGIQGMNGLWSDAHDSSFIDLIASGTAYELFRDGKEYVSITNVDNRAGVLDPALLALMDLTGKTLITELVEKLRGQKGGTAVRVKRGKQKGRESMERILKDDEGVFLLEGFEFSDKLWDELKEEAKKRMEEDKERKDLVEYINDLIGKYFPLFNTANYVLNIKGYVKDIFGIENDDEIVEFLKKFYNARNNPEEASRLRFEILETAYKFRLQSFEDEKRYEDDYPGVTALRPANLAGDQTRVVNTLMVEVPTGEKSVVKDPTGKEIEVFSRFEPQKEQLRNLVRLLRRYIYLCNRYGKEKKLIEILPMLTDVAFKRAYKGPMFGDIVKQTADKLMDWNIESVEYQTLGRIAETIGKGIDDMIASIKRMAKRGALKYPKGDDDVEDVICVDGVLSKNLVCISGIKEIPVDSSNVYFLDIKLREYSERKYSGEIRGDIGELSRYEEFLRWLEDKGINSVSISGEIKDIALDFFDVIAKIIERDGLDRLEEVSKELGIFNLYIAQDGKGKRLVITAPTESRILDAINKLVKFCSDNERLGELEQGLEKEIESFIDANQKAKTHYIRLDVARLMESPSLDYWREMIKRLSIYTTTSGVPLFRFVYFSSSEKVEVVNFLRENGLEGLLELPEGVSKTNVVTIVDPEDICRDLGGNTLFLPLPYMKGALLMAVNIVLNKGAVDNISDNVKEVIKALYKEILGKEVSKDDIKLLLTKPYHFLPNIRNIIEDLETLRFSIQMAEMAA